MSHLIELVRRPNPPAERPAHQPDQPAVGLGGVYVVFTSVAETLRAVEAASRLARAIALSLTLLHFRSVGFAAPLDHSGGVSPVETDAFKARLEAMDCDVAVRVCLCRNAFRVSGRRSAPPPSSSSAAAIAGGRLGRNAGGVRCRRRATSW
ncbi:MAG TPA: hypothetical protein VGK32_08030 [Vicinamibacterales bacterium]|jgi:hypothetical protein